MASDPTWAGDVGRVWAAMHEATDRHMQEIGALVLERLDARPGERIIDLGCGAGTTTRAIAEAVGPEGHVLGVDVSGDLAAQARRIVAGLPQAEVILADAARHAFAPGRADALFSRHGCMFFADPAAAFANLRRGLRPGARVALSAFAPLAGNPWASTPMAVVEATLGPAAPVANPPPGGPFSWGDPAVFEAALAAAGFRDVGWEGRDVSMTIGAGDDPDPVERAWAVTQRIGVVARRLADEDPAAVARVGAALRAVFAPCVRDGWVRMGGRIWLIEARA
ncbi:methyltransferase domain-containing protein [Amaricoccus sp.]|uniref:methyltransferase domain-containing protein n=1 Tax=Amaricoccus sp. TaxID=1872485 RepID=UPI001B55E079|nr:methyltransferase domain-containing protein [Amaricoccus sp.]MBP7001475.1 methyltransferase domain-containing protein [Amaricoccus sp.]